MEKDEAKRTLLTPARSETVVDEGAALLDKLPTLPGESEIIKKQEDVAQRAKDYTEANEADLEED